MKRFAKSFAPTRAKPACANSSVSSAAVCRSVATRVADGFKEPISRQSESLHAYLGPQKFFNEIALRTSLPGVATGLAWTPFGGDILFVEATQMAGDGKLILTGQLGDVMKESAQAALSLVKSRADSLGIDPAIFKKNDLHIHIPAGASPRTAPVPVSRFLSRSFHF